jgi:ABC-type polysaccharide/polyol phosphate export permease
MAQTIQAGRYSIITHDSVTTRQIFNGGFYQYIPYLIVIAVCLLGALFFRKQSKFFAEEI